MHRLWIVLVLAGLLNLGWGLSRGEFQTVKRWTETLCTSCIGLSVEAHP
jgi:hypothetical protein